MFYMEILLLFGFILGIIFFVFSSAYSAIPFFPTNNKDLKKVIEALKLEKDQVIVDLGAGTGTVIFAAATEAHKKGLNTAFVAIDINFVLVMYMLIKAQFHPHKEHIKILRGDLFRMDYEKIVASYKKITYYIYVSPWFTDTLAEIIEHTGKPGRLVSYFYPVKKLKPIEKDSSGQHDIYVYKV